MHSGSKQGSLVLIAAAGAAALALTSCAAPETRFVSSDEHDVVVQLPWNWEPIQRDDVLAARPDKPSEEESALPEGTWIQYYDGARKPSAQHVLAETVEAPIVLLQSSAVAEEARTRLTPDMMRDIFRPVTAAARAQNDALTQAGGAKPEQFSLVTDEQITTRTSRGVHVVYRYGSGAAQEVYDQVVATDPARERIHVLIVHCSASCYGRNQGRIAAIADSFTIKKP